MAILRQTIENNKTIINPNVTHIAVVEFEVINGIPNGDPDAGGGARIDTDGRALVTDVATKRKVRDYAEMALGRTLYIPRNLQDLVPEDERAGGKATLKDWARMHGVIDGKEEDSATDAQKAIEAFWDVRLFGAVIGAMKTKKQILGPTQVSICVSDEPVEEVEMTITRMASEEEDKERGMGTKTIVRKATFKQKVTFTGHLAKRHNVTEEDLADLWEGLINGFEFRPSTMRGDQRCVKLTVFTYPNEFGAGTDYTTTVIENPAPAI
jgi:CRISPR-associated protein Csd2